MGLLAMTISELKELLMCDEVSAEQWDCWRRRGLAMLKAMED